MALLRSTCLPILLLLLAHCQPKVASPTYSTNSNRIEEINFDFLHCKAKLKLSDNNKERDVRANIRIRKDSIIWMNFSVVGLQGGRILINQDSLVILDNLNKKYYVYTFEDLSRRYNLPISYAFLEAALLGNIIAADHTTDLGIPVGGQQLFVTKLDSAKLYSFVSLKSRKVARVKFEDEQLGVRMNIEYSNFQQLVDKNFPYIFRFGMHFRNEAGEWKDLYISLDYQKVERGNKELKFPFNIPKKYVRG